MAQERPNMNNAMKHVLSAAKIKKSHERKKSEDFAEGNIKSGTLTVDYRIPAPSEREIATSSFSKFSKPEINEYGMSNKLYNKTQGLYKHGQSEANRSQLAFQHLPNPSLYSYRSLTMEELTKIHENLHISNFREPTLE